MRFLLLVAGLALGSFLGCSTTPPSRPATTGHADDHTHGPAASGVVVEELARSTQSWNGTPLPPYPDGQPEIVVLRITVPPRTALPWHVHPVPNAGVLTAGTLIVRTPDGPAKRLHAGDALIELVNSPHRGVNDSDQPAQVIVVYASTPGERLSVPVDGDP